MCIALYVLGFRVWAPGPRICSGANTQLRYVLNQVPKNVMEAAFLACNGYARMKAVLAQWAEDERTCCLTNTSTLFGSEVAAFCYSFNFMSGGELYRAYKHSPTNVYLDIGCRALVAGFG